MQLTKTIPLATLLLSAPFAAADDLGSEDVPRACTGICRPIRQLVRQCDVDDDRVGGDRNEDRLERHCVCTNDSFDVAKVAGLCQSCIDEHWDDGCVDSDSDDDDIEDCDDGRKAMRKIMNACNFSSVDYDSKATSTDVSVSASPYTDVAQLTSATASASTTTTTTSSARETNSNGDNNSSNNDDDNDNIGNARSGDSDNQDDGDDSAAGRAAMPGMAAVFGVVAAGALM